MNVTDIELCKIRTEKRLWEVDEDKIKPLAESIKTFGLINPISVLEDGDNYVLIAGEHRLLAYVYNEEITIPTIIHKRQYENIELDKARCLIMEADENLLRRTPDGHEEAYLLYRRKEAYEILFPTPTSEKIKKLKKDINYRVENGLPYEELEKELNDLENHKSFVEDTVEKTGLSKRTINQKVRIGTIIDKETGEILDNMNISTEIFKKIVIGDNEEDAKVASKIYTDTIKTIDDKFEKPKERNNFFNESYNKLKTEMNEQEPKYHVNHPIEFSELLQDKIQNEYLPKYEESVSSPVGSQNENEETTYYKKGNNVLICTISFIENHGESVTNFITVHLNDERRFEKVKNIIDTYGDEDNIMVVCSDINIFSNYIKKYENI
ncbi:ParB N-terminal domain-containing protein [Clostridium botulinum]|uniref:ParB-like N-terminal domain-containing protein n=1 Tax=Clostridium botulinum TaxID=1491 RepID=A0A6B4JQB2_CLOBO|nr:ParB N-terminal domain-containing protein [Clostridium botulinum]EES48425.1 conserved hypothetical protein [Clostridium botulinum E1 str. 'BoNT E Beluga']MBY6762568.1 ParB N-terminal domain-containing protein [Clostridium botulinum]MBY6920983.1 ParB N-terminal domain-containing protein [Clostridium botulinum]MCR1132922.1 ParB N-terminal domain-containing protein [Clostridium botulinum]NFH69604.1 hypothetical protein [Clostridium botulinum]